MRKLHRGGSRKALQPAFEAKIPKPLVISNTYHFVEAEAQNYVRGLAGLDPLPIDADAKVRLIRLSTLAESLDCHPRTLKRRVEETYGKLAAEAEATAAPASGLPRLPNATLSKPFEGWVRRRPLTTSASSSRAGVFRSRQNRNPIKLLLEKSNAPRRPPPPVRKPR